MEAGSPAETAWTGKYEVLRPLAFGGMAELHLVRACDPERLVVVKRLRRELAIDPEFIRMFLDEARIASTLHHPNIVEVHEIGENAGQCYIAMEHLHGHDLRDVMARRQPLRLEQALSIARSVAVGLHYTHERTDAEGTLLGIVHRDVSPHNVFLTYDGGVKIVDFGIAKASTQLSRTRTGVLKGKIAYMSPEQAMGQRLDRRSDVFGIGILLWEMTTGRWLYHRRSELDTLNAVASERPQRPSRVVSRYPRDLERLVMKTLARSREERWAKASELIDAIDEIARRRRYSLGPEVVSELMATAFPGELGAWRAAHAIGVSLGDHLVAQGEAAVRRSDDDDELPEVALGTPPPGQRLALRRRLWPALGVAAAGTIAAIWIASATRRDRAPSIAPGSTPAPATPVPAVTRVPPPPAASSLAAPAASSPAVPIALPGTASSAAAASAPVSRSAVQTPPAEPAPARTGPVNRSPGAEPAKVRAAATARPGAAAAPAAGSAAPPKAKPARKPTIEELDRLP
jgi:hypothetical protein